MSRAHERDGIEAGSRFRLIEGDADRFEVSLAEVRVAVEEAREEMNAKLNKLILSVLGLTLTIIGGLVMVVVTSGVGK